MDIFFNKMKGSIFFFGTEGFKFIELLVVTYFSFKKNTVGPALAAFWWVAPAVLLASCLIELEHYKKF